METRYVPDASATWLVYGLGDVVLALPAEFRAVADAIAAMPRAGADAVRAALEASGIAASAPFAVLETGSGGPGGLRILLRGPATVAAGAETFTGLGAERHLDRRVTGVAAARLSVPGGEWTFAFGPGMPAAPALRPNEEETAFPDEEPSEPVAAPPTLGLLEPPTDADDRTVLVSELVDAGIPLAPTEDKTVVVEEIAELRAKKSSGLGAPGAVPPPAPAPAAPAAFQLELPDGSREPLDVVVVIGRAPSIPAGPPARVVRLTGDGDISRNHARVTVEGGVVVVTDLGSRNGTIVRIPARPPQKLRRDEPTPVLPGTVIDFGGGVEVRVTET